MSLYSTLLSSFNRLTFYGCSLLTRQMNVIIIKTSNYLLFLLSVVCDDTIYCSETNECLSPAAKPICNGKFECPDQSDEETCPSK